MHAVFLARELGIARGARAALPRRVLGLGDARDRGPQGHEPRATSRRSPSVDRDDLAALLAELEADGLAGLADEGIAPSRPARRARARPPLQRPGVHADDPAGGRGRAARRAASPRRSRAASTTRTGARFGHANPGAPVEVGRGALDRARRPRPRRAGDARRTARRARSRSGARSSSTARRTTRRRSTATTSAAAPSSTGPAVISEQTATTVVPPGARGHRRRDRDARRAGRRGGAAMATYDRRPDHHRDHPQRVHAPPRTR